MTENSKRIEQIISSYGVLRQCSNYEHLSIFQIESPCSGNTLVKILEDINLLGFKTKVRLDGGNLAIEVTY